MLWKIGRLSSMILPRSNGIPPVEQEATADAQASKHWLRIEDGKIVVFDLEFGGWGSLVALMASVASLGWTTYDKFLVQPSPELWSPEEINVVCDYRGDTSCQGDDKVYLRATPITLINKTPGEHPFTVRSMDAEIILQDANDQPVKKICLDWEYLSSMTTVGSNSKPVGPFEVKSGSPFVQEVEFYPRRKPDDNGAISTMNFLPFRQMEQLVSQGAIKQIELNFEIEIVGRSDRITTACKVPIDGDFVQNAKAGTTEEFYSRECVSVKAHQAECSR